MKRIIIALLTIVMLVMSVAIAEGNTQTDPTPADGQPAQAQEAQRGQSRRQAAGRRDMGGTWNAKRSGMKDKTTGEEAPDQLSGTKGGASGRIDFDAMVERGVISQETRDRISAYLNARRASVKSDAKDETQAGEQVPEGAEEGEAAPDAQTDAEEAKSGGSRDAAVKRGRRPEQKAERPAKTGLLDRLLAAEVITQAEYDAMNAALAMTAE